jgi:hypothetical protein
MKRLFTMAFFACGWIGLLLNLVFILVSFSREAEIGSASETAIEALWNRINVPGDLARWVRKIQE